MSGGVNHSKHIVFSSANTIEGRATNPANFTVNLGNQEFTAGEIIHAVPLDITVPNLFYNVTGANDKTIFNDGGGDIEITVPHGFYSFTSYSE